MPRPKQLRVLTAEPAHSAAAIAEWKAGIDDFLEWANRARTGDTSPVAVQADAVLTAFAEGASIMVWFSGLSPWAARAGQHILALIRNAHWHLARCRWCDQWLLAKDQRRTLHPSCRRPDCQRKTKTQRKAKERQLLRDRDRAAIRRARTF